MNKTKGFTLIELLVVVAITGLLVSLTFLFTRRSGQQVILFRERSQVAQTLIQARNFATNLYKDETGEKVCGYGVYFLNDDTYILFKDIATTADSCDGADREYTNENERVEEKQLDQVVRFETEIPKHTIVFAPPDPTVYFDGQEAGAGNEEAAITLYLTDRSSNAVVTVNQAGQVSTNE